MADESVKTVAEVASPEAQRKAEEASAEAQRNAEKERRSFANLGGWAVDFMGTSPPPRRVLLARSVTRNGSEVAVDAGAAWMPAGRLCLLASPGGKGKTAVLLHLAGHVAAGARWCGLEVVSPGAVALVVGEEDRDECNRRLCDVWADMPEEQRRRAASRTLVLPLAGTGDNRLVNEDPATRTAVKSERASELLAYLKAEGEKAGGFALVVVDPFARFAGMNAEADNASATSTMTVLEELTGLPGKPTVLVAHHTKKRGKDDGGADLAELIRGSSAIKDAARWAALLEADDPDESGNGRAVLRVAKSNYTSTAYAVELVTRYGIPKSGKVRSVRELNAEAAEERKADKATKSSKAVDALQAGAQTNEKRIGDVKGT